MSQFEYLRSTSIGQYLPLASPLHRMDPRAKLLAYPLLLLAVSLSTQVTGLLLALVIALLLMVISQTPLSYAWRGWLAALPFIIFLAGLQVFIIRPAEGSLEVFSLFGLSIYSTGIWASARLVLRFTVLFLLLTVSTATLSTLETIHGLDTLLKPLNAVKISTTHISMIVQVMMRFIPFLALNAEKIAKSQAARGAEWDTRKGGLVARARRVLPLIIPLFIISLRQAETLTDAMLARGFDSRRQRTSLQSFSFQVRDGILVFLAILSAWMILFCPL